MLKVIALGDSWFRYSYSLPSLRLNSANPFLGLLLNASRHGHHIEKLLSPDKDENDKLNKLLATIRDTEPDFILVSYGGNDLIDGPYLTEILTPRGDTAPDEVYLKYVNVPVLEARVDMVRSALAYLFKLIEARSPNTRVLVHTYGDVEPADEPVPGRYGILAKGKGPWIWPVMKDKDIGKEYRKDIALYILEKLRKGIEQAAAASDNATVVDVRDALNPGKPDWNDEIHPTLFGFCKVALKFVDAMRNAMPEREFLSIASMPEAICDQFIED